jgi:LruC domain-containing protein
MKKVDPATPNDTVEVNFTKEGNVYLLTEDVKGEINSTYILELIYNSGIADIAKLASIKPFIYRNEDADKRWEVHIPFEAPTVKMNTSYFGTKDDRSIVEEGKYFVRDSDYPFAFCLAGVTIDKFKNTILLRKNEKAPISQLYPEFLLWSTSKGEQNPDWYLHPAAE